MPTFKYSKLVRDKIPSFHIEAGHTIDSRVLKGKELTTALIAKLHEETDEISNTLTHDELLEEIADVQQIINDLCTVNDISQEQLHTILSKKADRKGGFLEGHYIETVSIPNEDDEWAEYCRRSPEKYPEIK